MSEGIVVLNRSEVIGQDRNVERNIFYVSIREQTPDLIIRARGSIGNTFGLARDNYQILHVFIILFTVNLEYIHRRENSAIGRQFGSKKAAPRSCYRRAEIEDRNALWIQNPIDVTNSFERR